MSSNLNCKWILCPNSLNNNQDNHNQISDYGVFLSFSRFDLRGGSLRVFEGWDGEDENALILEIEESVTIPPIIHSFSSPLFITLETSSSSSTTIGNGFEAVYFTTDDSNFSPGNSIIKISSALSYHLFPPFFSSSSSNNNQDQSTTIDWWVSLEESGCDGASCSLFIAIHSFSYFSSSSSSSHQFQIYGGDERNDSHLIFDSRSFTTNNVSFPLWVSPNSITTTTDSNLLKIDSMFIQYTSSSNGSLIDHGDLLPILRSDEEAGKKLVDFSSPLLFSVISNQSISHCGFSSSPLILFDSSFPLSDGSGRGNEMRNGENCEWIIHPFIDNEMEDEIILMLDEVDLTGGAVLKVFQSTNRSFNIQDLNLSSTPLSIENDVLDEDDESEWELMWDCFSCSPQYPIYLKTTTKSSSSTLLIQFSTPDDSSSYSLGDGFSGSYFILKNTNSSSSSSFQNLTFPISNFYNLEIDDETSSEEQVLNIREFSFLSDFRNLPQDYIPNSNDSTFENISISSFYHLPVLSYSNWSHVSSPPFYHQQSPSSSDIHQQHSTLDNTPPSLLSSSFVSDFDSNHPIDGFHEHHCGSVFISPQQPPFNISSHQSSPSRVSGISEDQILSSFPRLSHIPNISSRFQSSFSLNGTSSSLFDPGIDHSFSARSLQCAWLISSSTPSSPSSLNSYGSQGGNDDFSTSQLASRQAVEVVLEIEGMEGGRLRGWGGVTPVYPLIFHLVNSSSFPHPSLLPTFHTQSSTTSHTSHNPSSPIPSSSFVLPCGEGLVVLDTNASTWDPLTSISISYRPIPGDVNGAICDAYINYLNPPPPPPVSYLLYYIIFASVFLLAALFSGVYWYFLFFIFYGKERK